MNTLLFRLSGPMQSWGVQSRFSVRDTGLEPSKSGVLGLVCAALGVPRQDDATLSRLAALQMGVRVDREGRLSRDYQIAQNVLKAGGGTKNSDVSSRYYMADAIFLVGLQGDDINLLQQVQAKLEKPVWPLYLGRKAFIPSDPVCLEDGLKPQMALKEALQTYPYLGNKQEPERLRMIIESAQGEIVHQDQPISFKNREFAPRRVTISFTDIAALRKES